MDYIKISLIVNPAHEWHIDILASQLGEIGFESFVQTDDGLEAFIPEVSYNRVNLETIFSEQPKNVEITWSKELIKDRNWNEEWEKNYFEPLLIGEECVIRAPFHNHFPKAKYEIIIEPNMAFGTGNHETTSQMVEAILAEDLTGKAVLDMGCGTGILGILASMKGAEKITAVDISEWAFSGTKENAALNKIRNISVKLGDASLLHDEKYDVIFANIQKNVLIEDMPSYSNVLRAKGKLFMSGFYLEDLGDVRKAADKIGLKFLKHEVRKNWVVAVFQS
ncbi:MAG TPA: 50S ribosomal protein L11 methyltransferase [Prolixibacteraceae bacterium]|nr:50S ribosomal protein L11 methyltransferase [Prolixibacteraceae bacterium]